MHTTDGTAYTSEDNHRLAVRLLSVGEYEYCEIAVKVPSCRTLLCSSYFNV
jgi:hypothetical protein